MEKTYLSEVYDSFLSSITDYTLLDESLSIQEIEEDLFSYFKKARARFYKCKNSLKLLEDEEGQYFGYNDPEKQIVEVQLTDFEVLILTQLMLVEYTKQKVLSTETMSQSLSDKDFRIYSQANQLRELKLLSAKMQRDASKLITEYSYMGMTDNDKK